MVQPTLNKFRWIMPKREEDTLRLLSLPATRRVSRSWKPIDIVWVPETAKRAICDYPCFSINVDAYSNRAAKALGGILKESGEFLSLRGLRDRYVAHHPLRTSNALDMKRSQLDYDKRDKLILTIEKAVFKKSMLEPFPLFRISSFTFVRNEFRQIVEREKLSGFSFRECELV